MRHSQTTEDRVLSAVRDFASSIISGSKVVADMSALINATAELPPTHFAHWERLIQIEFNRILRDSTQPKWKFWSKPQELLTWLDLASWDGYRRERVLRTLSGAAPNTFFFSLAIRRLNDWVPQVRIAAREKLPEIAAATNPYYVVEAVCIALASWNSWGRIEELEKQALLQIISRDEIAEALKSKIILSASGPMASLFSQLGRTTILDSDLVEIAQCAVQPSVRAKAYRSLFEGRIAWIEGREWQWTDIRYCEGRVNAVVSERKFNVQIPFLELLKGAAIDRSSVVRRVSAEFLIKELETLGDGARCFAEKFAADKSNPVSERGRFALRMLDKAERANFS
ncbi:MAG: hypothetical protein CVV11_09125 [Gammaproteobacteria bacterium HGW-Gammaproteobacteria-15]|nr:MAG: hypothetical protein CVV11_09125 [Gammaproteobacteria bacterium HGW-Gammaproteobacteria-15]